MNDERLRKALERAVQHLRTADGDYPALERLVRLLPEQRGEKLANLGVYAGRLQSGLRLFEARSESSRRIDALRGIAASAGGPAYVAVDGTEVRFELERLFRFQTYATTTWSLYDTVWDALLAVSAGSDVLPDRHRCGLLGFGLCGKGSKLGRIGEVLTRLNGWSAAFSYQVRNLLVHDAGWMLSPDAFAGNDVAAGFAVGEALFARVKDGAEKEKWKIGQNMTWRKEAWPWSNDLKVLLDACNEDIDNVFTQLLHWMQQTSTQELAVLTEGI